MLEKLCVVFSLHRCLLPHFFIGKVHTHLMHSFTPFAKHLSHIDTENARFPRNICIQNMYAYCIEVACVHKMAEMLITQTAPATTTTTTTVAVTKMKFNENVNEF